MSIFIEQYLMKASEIVGDRTPEEVAFDKIILSELRKGHPIRMALKTANKRYPNEALHYSKENIEDIASHYDYLLNHEDIMNRFKEQLSN